MSEAASMAVAGRERGGLVYHAGVRAGQHQLVLHLHHHVVDIHDDAANVYDDHHRPDDHDDGESSRPAGVAGYQSAPSSP